MISLVRELWLFMRERRKFLLAPVFIVLLLVGGLLALAQGAAAPFIYALF
ncbi:MAG TPA: DUF5989 family protein [Alphaproteobacteria bacterium]|jgi:hypothetical protein|nr:DUF5989 family protein [Alphaproteobacteria bacterium]